MGPMKFWLMSPNMSAPGSTILKESLALGISTDPSRVLANTSWIWKVAFKIWFIVLSSRKEDWQEVAMEITKLFLQSEMA